MSDETATALEIIDIPLKDFDFELDDRTKDQLKDVSALAANMEAMGQITPVMVMEPNGDGKYKIISGKRRYAAAKSLKWGTLKAFVWEGDEKLQKLVTLSDNIFKMDVTDIKKAAIFKDLLDARIYKNQSELAKAFGVSQPFVSRLISLLDESPDVQKAVMEKQIPKSKVTKGSKKVKSAEKKAGKRTAKKIKSEHEAERWTKMADALLIPKEGKRNTERMNVYVSSKKIRIIFVLPASAFSVAKGGLLDAVTEEIKAVGEKNLIQGAIDTLKKRE